jgi:hypothetical protein
MVWQAKGSHPLAERVAARAENARAALALYPEKREMDGANELDACLGELRESGWHLSTRRVYTLKRRGQLHSFHGEELEDVVRRAEVREVATSRRPKLPTEPGKTRR